MKQTWTILGTVASIMALGLAAWLGYASGTLTSPHLEFGFGALKGQNGGDLRRAGLSNDGPVTFLVIATDQPTTGRAVFQVPFYIANRSARALHDVVVRLTYPTRVAAKFDEITLVDPVGKVKLNPEYAKLRTVKITDTLATTEFQISILRPGEGMLLGDMFILGDPSFFGPNSTKGSDVRRLTFPERLKEHLDLFDVFRVQAFAAAAEAGPYTAQLSVVWARGGSSTEALAAIGDRVASAAWGPYRPKPGLYFKWPWEPNPGKTEFFELSHAPLSKGVDDVGHALYVQQIMETGLVPFSTSMPNWDYWGVIAQ